MRIVAIIQARMGSTRLPGKVMKRLAGETVLSHVVSRVRAAGPLDEIVVATTTSPNDAVIVEEALRLNVRSFRGSEEDVLARYYFAAKENGADAVMRATADDPLIDPEVLSGMLKLYRSEDAAGRPVDYLSNNLGKRSYPLGLDAEVVRFTALEKAYHEAKEAPEREHVTPFIYRHPEKFSLKNYPSPVDLSAHRWTLDTEEDWKIISEIFTGLHRPGKIFSTQETLDFLKKQFDRLVLGSAQLGLRYGIVNQSGMPDADNAVSLIREALSAGVRHIDTARAYGEAEPRIGMAVAGAEDVCVVTKLDPMSHLGPDASAEAVREAVDESIRSSRKNLNAKKLAILLLHRWEHRSAWRGAAWSRLLELKKEGQIKKLGASVYTPEEAKEALKEPEVEHIQLPFNVLDRRWGKGVEKPGVTVDARSVFLQGLLTADQAPYERFKDVPLKGWLKKMDRLVKEFGRESRADLCLAYVKSQDWIHGIVLGMETQAQLKENLKLFKKPSLNRAQCAKVESELVGAGEGFLNPSKWSSV